MDKQHFIIKENSFVARLAAIKLRTSAVAIVFGKTIYLHNTTSEEFLKNERWVKHELCHIRQFQQHGYVPFILKYVWESLRSGYYNNKYEAEARAAELL